MASRLSNWGRSMVIVAVSSLLVAVAALVLWSNSHRAEKPLQSDPNDHGTLPVQFGRESFVTSEVCRKCHVEQHKSWHESYHRTMTQVATSQTVAAPLDGLKLESRGRTYQFERRGEEFWVTMATPQEAAEQSQEDSVDAAKTTPVRARKIVATTGSHVAQTYWISYANDLWQVPWVYHIQEQKWIPNEDSFLHPPTDSQNFHRWNSNCIKCHTVGAVPGLTAQGEYKTRVVEFGISCESCHGAGEDHVRFREGKGSQQSADASNGVKDPITNPTRCSAERASEICAQCHSSHRDPEDWNARGSSFYPGEQLEKHVKLHHFGTGVTKHDYKDGYWADGTCRTGGDEFLGMMASPCYAAGKMSCLSCHSMHGYASTTYQLKPGMEGNQACLQCHADMKDRVAEHTHHGEKSSGSLCYNCHVPYIAYGLFKGIRSHRVDSPSAEVEVKTGRPTACNLCHVDKPLGWTASQLAQWYGQPRPELSKEQESTSAVAMMALQGDAMQRVLAAWHLGWESALETSRKDWQAPYLAYLLDDPYPVVRYVSYRSLQSLPGFDKFSYDFVAEKGLREQAKERAIELWRQQTRKPFGEAGRAILLDEQGQLKVDVVEEFWRKRNDRPVEINE